jgi:Flp pilus assembly protein TadD
MDHATRDQQFRRGSDAQSHSQTPQRPQRRGAKRYSPAAQRQSQRRISPRAVRTSSIGKQRIFGCNKSLCQLCPTGAQQCTYLGGYGRSLKAQNTKSSNAQALKILQKAHNLDSRDTRILRDIGTAYARSGQQGQAVLAIAERYALQGNITNAAIQAKRAEDLLPRDSAAWQRIF